MSQSLALCIAQLSCVSSALRWDATRLLGRQPAASALGMPPKATAESTVAVAEIDTAGLPHRALVWPATKVMKRAARRGHTQVQTLSPNVLFHRGPKLPNPLMFQKRGFISNNISSPPHVAGPNGSTWHALVILFLHRMLCYLHF